MIHSESCHKRFYHPDYESQKGLHSEKHGNGILISNSTTKKIKNDDKRIEAELIQLYDENPYNNEIKNS